MHLLIVKIRMERRTTLLPSDECITYQKNTEIAYERKFVECPDEV